MSAPAADSGATTPAACTSFAYGWQAVSERVDERNGMTRVRGRAKTDFDGLRRRFTDDDHRFVNREKILRPIRMANTVIDRECLPPGWDVGRLCASNFKYDGGPRLVGGRRSAEIESV